MATNEYQYVETQAEIDLKRIKSAHMAAKQGYGAGVTVRVLRYKLDGTRCGMAQGRHAQWNWAFRVQVPGCNRMLDLGRGLVNARTFAARLGEFVHECWDEGGKFQRGPNGGLKRVGTFTTVSAD